MRRKRQRQAVEGRPEVVLSRRSAGREKILFYVCFALAAYLVWRLYDVQIIQGPMLAAKALGQQSAIFSVSAQRGAIYTTDGVLLARSLPSRSVYASPDAIPDLARTAGIVAHVLGEPTATAIAQIKEMPHYHVIAWKIPDPQARALLALDLPGISVEAGDVGQALLAVGPARVDVTRLRRPRRRRSRGDRVRVRFAAARLGRPDDDGDRRVRARSAVRQAACTCIPPKTGDSLVLTIDSYLQYTAEHVLAKTVKQFSALSGVAIIMDPYSGALLRRRERAELQRPLVPALHARSAARPCGHGRLRTGFDLQTHHRDGRARVAQGDDRVDVPRPRPLEVGGSVIHNAEDGLMASAGGTESLETIIALSHNVGAAEVGLRIGPHAMYKTMRAFGFGDPTEVDLPGENPGILPPLDSWSATSLPTMSFGHGIAITPIALARAYAAIANGGVLVRPRILGEIVGPDGNVIYRYGREVERRVMSQATSQTLCCVSCARSSCTAPATRRRRSPVTRRPGRRAPPRSQKAAVTSRAPTSLRSSASSPTSIRGS